MNLKQTEKIFLSHEREKVFYIKNFKKLSKLKKKQLLKFCNSVYSNQQLKKNWRYINLLLKCQKVLKVKYYSLNQLKKIYND